ALTPSILLVPERRTDKVFAMNIASASDITPLEDATGRLLADASRSIESLGFEELTTYGIRPAKKALIVPKITALDAALEKCEGLAVAGRTLVLCQDNDFNLVGVDASTNPATIILQTPNNLPKIV